jgi:HPt (histidine-containing phosphotransfer) domain-containing protein
MGQTAGDKPDAVDLEILRGATVGDRDIMQELASLYLSDTDLQLRALGDALQNKEADRLKRIGASLTTASQGIGAEPAAAIFHELEEAAKAGDFDRVARAIEEGRAEFARVQKALADLR